MKLKYAISQLLIAASLVAATAQVAEASVTATIGDGIRGTQLGRLSRNGIPQTWDHDEAVPATINPTLTYFFTTFSVNVGLTNFLDVNFDSLSANTFLSIYQTSFNPLNLQQNWLGDTGTSGNFFGTDPLFADVVAALNSTVILVVTTTSGTTLGLADPFTLLVSAYPNADLGSVDPVELQPLRVPEPSTLLLLLAPLGLIAGRKLGARRHTTGALAAA